MLIQDAHNATDRRLCNWIKDNENMRLIKLPFMINTFDCSSDGDNIAITFLNQNIIQIYNISLEVQVGSNLNGHTKQIATLKYSRDGKFIASSGQDSNIKIWDSFTQLEVQNIQEHVSQLDFSPNAQQIVTFQQHKPLIKTWCCRTGKNLARITLELCPMGVKYFINESCLIYSQDECLHIRDLRTNQLVQKINRQDSFDQFELSSHDSFIICGDRMQSIIITDNKTRKLIRKLLAQVDREPYMYAGHIKSYTQQHQLLSLDGVELRVWDLKSAKNTLLLKSKQVDKFELFSLSPDNRFIIYQNDQYCIKIKRISQTKVRKTKK